MVCLLYVQFISFFNINIWIHIIILCPSQSSLSLSPVAPSPEPINWKEIRFEVFRGWSVGGYLRNDGNKNLRAHTYWSYIGIQGEDYRFVQTTFKMKTRWHHLVSYPASRCLPPPQPQSMSTPLSHCLVDCHLSPSSWPSTTIIVEISILHLLGSSFRPLLSCVPPPSSPIFCRRTFRRRHCRHQHRRHHLRLPPTFAVFCLIVVYWRLLSLSLLPCLSFDPFFSSMEPLPPCLSTSHSRLPLPPRSHLFLPP